MEQYRSFGHCLLDQIQLSHLAVGLDLMSNLRCMSSALIRVTLLGVPFFLPPIFECPASNSSETIAHNVATLRHRASMSDSLIVPVIR